MKRVILVILVATLVQAASQPLTVPFFKQEKNGCGAASVAMVMHYWSGQQPGAPTYPSHAEVYGSLYDADLRGIPLVEMKQYLEGHGFRAYTLHGLWTDLEQHLEKGRPLVVALKKKDSAPIHFAVVTGTASDRVLLNDPTRKGTTRMKRADFEKQWSRADSWLLLATPQR